MLDEIRKACRATTVGQRRKESCQIGKRPVFPSFPSASSDADNISLTFFPPSLTHPFHSLRSCIRKAGCHSKSSFSPGLRSQQTKQVSRQPSVQGQHQKNLTQPAYPVWSSHCVGFAHLTHHPLHPIIPFHHPARPISPLEL
jgi:hypothetical protein